MDTNQGSDGKNGEAKGHVVNNSTSSITGYNILGAKDEPLSSARVRNSSPDIYGFDQLIQGSPELQQLLDNPHGQVMARGPEGAPNSRPRASQPSLANIQVVKKQQRQKANVNYIINTQTNQNAKRSDGQGLQSKDLRVQGIRYDDPHSKNLKNSPGLPDDISSSGFPDPQLLSDTQLQEVHKMYQDSRLRTQQYLRESRVAAEKHRASEDLRAFNHSAYDQDLNEDLVGERALARWTMEQNHNAQVLKRNEAKQGPSTEASIRALDTEVADNVVDDAAYRPAPGVPAANRSSTGHSGLGVAEEASKTSQSFFLANRYTSNDLENEMNKLGPPAGKTNLDRELDAQFQTQPRSAAPIGISKLRPKTSIVVRKGAAHITKRQATSFTQLQMGKQSYQDELEAKQQVLHEMNQIEQVYQNRELFDQLQREVNNLETQNLKAKTSKQRQLKQKNAKSIVDFQNARKQPRRQTAYQRLKNSQKLAQSVLEQRAYKNDAGGGNINAATAEEARDYIDQSRKVSEPSILIHKASIEQITPNAALKGMLQRRKENWCKEREQAMNFDAMRAQPLKSKTRTHLEVFSQKQQAIQTGVFPSHPSVTTDAMSGQTGKNPYAQSRQEDRIANNSVDRFTLDKILDSHRSKDLLRNKIGMRANAFAHKLKNETAIVLYQPKPEISQNTTCQRFLQTHKNQLENSQGVPAANHKDKIEAVGTNDQSNSQMMNWNIKRKMHTSHKILKKSQPSFTNLQKKQSNADQQMAAMQLTKEQAYFINNIHASDLYPEMALSGRKEAIKVPAKTANQSLTATQTAALRYVRAGRTGRQTAQFDQSQATPNDHSLALYTGNENNESMSNISAKNAFEQTAGQIMRPSSGIVSSTHQYLSRKPQARLSGHQTKKNKFMDQRQPTGVLRKFINNQIYQQRPKSGQQIGFNNLNNSMKNTFLITKHSAFESNSPATPAPQLTYKSYQRSIEEFNINVQQKIDRLSNTPRRSQDRSSIEEKTTNLVRKSVVDKRKEQTSSKNRVLTVDSRDQQNRSPSMYSMSQFSQRKVLNEQIDIQIIKKTESSQLKSVNQQNQNRAAGNIPEATQESKDSLNSYRREENGAKGSRAPSPTSRRRNIEKTKQELIGFTEEKHHQSSAERSQAYSTRSAIEVAAFANPDAQTPYENQAAKGSLQKSKTGTPGIKSAPFGLNEPRYSLGTMSPALQERDRAEAAAPQADELIPKTMNQIQRLWQSLSFSLINASKQNLELEPLTENPKLILQQLKQCRKNKTITILDQNASTGGRERQSIQLQLHKSQAVSQLSEADREPAHQEPSSLDGSNRIAESKDATVVWKSTLMQPGELLAHGKEDMEQETEQAYEDEQVENVRSFQKQMASLAPNALEKGTGLSAPAESWDLQLVSYGAMNLQHAKADGRATHNSASQMPGLQAARAARNQQENIYYENQTTSHKMNRSATPGSMQLLPGSNGRPSTAANVVRHSQNNMHLISQLSDHEIISRFPLQDSIIYNEKQLKGLRPIDPIYTREESRSRLEKLSSQKAIVADRGSWKLASGPLGGNRRASGSANSETGKQHSNDRQSGKRSSSDQRRGKSMDPPQILQNQKERTFKAAAHQISRDLGDGSEGFQRQLRIVSASSKNKCEPIRAELDVCETKKIEELQESELNEDLEEEGPGQGAFLTDLVSVPTNEGRMQTQPDIDSPVARHLGSTDLRVHAKESNDYRESVKTQLISNRSSRTFRPSSSDAHAQRQSISQALENDRPAIEFAFRKTEHGEEPDQEMQQLLESQHQKVEDVRHFITGLHQERQRARLHDGYGTFYDPVQGAQQPFPEDPSTPATEAELLNAKQLSVQEVLLRIHRQKTSQLGTLADKPHTAAAARKLKSRQLKKAQKKDMRLDVLKRQSQRIADMIEMNGPSLLDASFKADSMPTGSLADLGLRQNNGVDGKAPLLTSATNGQKQAGAVSSKASGAAQTPAGELVRPQSRQSKLLKSRRGARSAVGLRYATSKHKVAPPVGLALQGGYLKPGPRAISSLGLHLNLPKDASPSPNPTTATSSPYLRQFLDDPLLAKLSEPSATITNADHLRILEKAEEIRNNIWSYEWPQEAPASNLLAGNEETRIEYGNRLRDTRKQLIEEVERTIHEVLKRVEDRRGSAKLNILQF